MLPEKEPILSYNMLLRSRYSETDKMGFVYHSRYLEYFEVVRTEFIREAGLPYSRMENEGVMLPVANVKIRYKQPILYDEKMDARLLIFDEPKVRLVTYYDIRPVEAHQIHVQGMVELVFVDIASRKPVRAPNEFIQKIRSYAELA